MSKKIVWTKKYSVNVKELDNQHKEFFKIANDLVALAESKSLTDEIAMIKVMKMGDYVAYHLGTEEELFIQTKYPGAPAHIKSHDFFRKKITELIKQVRDKKTDTVKVVAGAGEFSIKWYSNHILKIDKKYSKFFNEHGIK